MEDCKGKRATIERGEVDIQKEREGKAEIPKERALCLGSAMQV